MKPGAFFGREREAQREVDGPRHRRKPRAPSPPSLRSLGLSSRTARERVILALEAAGRPLSLAGIAVHVGVGEGPAWRATVDGLVRNGAILVAGDQPHDVGPGRPVKLYRLPPPPAVNP